ncbi:MAG TPA: hypothetical protein VK072_04225 [Candidatus Avamphibacillus sp.]|nr:hypothetical protein [Candidatus Avamphibacillus sp.]
MVVGKIFLNDRQNIFNWFIIILFICFISLMGCNKEDEDEGILLGGQVIVEEDGFRVEGESNLAEGTVVIASLLYNPFNVYRSFDKTSC